MIIAIDGPAASGKGTLAKKLAEALQLVHLDTGKLYRFIAWQMVENNINIDDADFESQLRGIVADISLEGLTNPALLAEQVGQQASKVSANPLVREQLVPLQRNLAQHIPNGKNGLILDGRDIGTVIFPDADYKFFLDADTKIRALRRFEELQAQGKDADLADVEQMIIARDEADSKRALAPLKPADDAIHLDSSQLTIDEMVKQAKNHISD